ncbi:DUF1643 domain-containing protein [Arthrobacter sp. TE12232]
MDNTSSDRRTLLAICSNPPTTTGTRTLNRVNLLAELMGINDVLIGNLCAAPTYRTGELTNVAAHWGPWGEAREQLMAGFEVATDVLLAYGLVEPLGAARRHRRQQLEWLQGQLRTRVITAWTVGGTPRHPSRWQRHTFRQHPGTPFPLALLESVTLADVTHSL